MTIVTGVLNPPQGLLESLLWGATMALAATTLLKNDGGVAAAAGVATDIANLGRLAHLVV
jgi:hypothetical protein